MTLRIAVAGAGGQLGAAVVYEFRKDHDVLPLSHADLDITDDAAVASAMERARPDIIVNCAALSGVDAAEDCPTDALEVNAFGVRVLARAADRIGATLVHYGSDFVFDGSATEPYGEEAKPNPISAYGASKMLGDWFALDAHRAYVLRVESLFGRTPDGPTPRGSVAGLLNGLLTGSSPFAFEDRVVSPTYLGDAAHATRLLLERRAEPGLYHCVNSGSATWLEVAIELAHLLEVEPKIEKGRLEDKRFRAQRPKYCALSNAKLRAAGIDMPRWQDALARYVAQVRATTQSR